MHNERWHELSMLYFSCLYMPANSYNNLDEVVVEDEDDDNDVSSAAALEEQPQE